MLSPEEQDKIFNGLLKRKQNQHCAECGSKSPCWASLAFGVFVCLNCSGAHRALSYSVTRVKSIRLDSWKQEELDNMMLGNSHVNMYWEYQLADDRVTKPNEHSSIDFLIRFVKDKYVRKMYVNPNEEMDPLKKAKMNKMNTGEVNLQTQKPKQEQKVSQQPQRILKICKEEPKSAKQPSKNIAATTTPLIQKKSDQPTKKPFVADFSFFDKIVTQMATTKIAETKQETNNLLGFEVDNPKENKKNNFKDFQFGIEDKPKQERYCKQQFMSMGGIKPKQAKTDFNFDSFLAGQKSKVNTNLINVDTEEKKEEKKSNHRHSVLGDYFTSNAAQGKGQFATMGGGPPPLPPKANTLTNSANWGHHISGLAHKNNKKVPQMNNTITLESNINLEGLNSKVENGQKSWTDDWK